MEELWGRHGDEGAWALELGAVEGEGDNEGAQQDARVHSQGACKLQAQQTEAGNESQTARQTSRQAQTHGS